MPLRWLHLSDIHIGRTDDVQRVAIESIVQEVKRRTSGVSVDAILITGDLAYSGLSPEYDRLWQLLLAPLLSTPELSSARILVVPGNHDIDGERVLPVHWDRLGAPRQQQFFQNTVPGRQFRKTRADGFEAFSTFRAARKIEGLDPTVDVSSVVRFHTDLGPVDFLCINTALFSDKYESDEGIAPAPTQAIRSLISPPNDTYQRFILAHHPIAWFQHVHQEPLKSLLLQEYLVYLHGHTHRVMVDTTMHGLRSFGFGAIYQAPLDAPHPTFYENTFALCHLDETLHVALASWDPQHGRWHETTKLPAEFQQRSSILEGGYQFDLPIKAVRRLRSAGTVSPHARRMPRVETLVSLGEPAPDAWKALLYNMGFAPRGHELTLVSGDRAPGHVEFLFTDSRGVGRVRCIAGRGHVLSAREVEAENTRLDSEEHDSLVVVSLGEIADEARTLALRLERKKPFRILTNRDLSKQISSLLSGPLAEHIEALDATSVLTQYLLLDTGIGLLVRERVKDVWFYILDSTGRVIDESDAIVRKLRENQPELADSFYRSTDAAIPHASIVPKTPFDRAKYLELCQAEFNTLKYAPLAAVGIRFPNTKLPDVYVPANAEVGDTNAETASYRQAVSDLVESLQLDDAQRLQLELQIRQGLGGASSREIGAARALYQQFGNVLVLGDPGSGKTCFGKNEILTYCKPPETGASWYKLHVPVFVPLAEAATLFADDYGLIRTAATLASRRGLPLNEHQLETLLAEGHVAFFFDGLDEVALVEQRARLVEAITTLLVGRAPLGNRFVLTSRPAAVQLIDIPPQLTTLQLRGFSDAEMRNLAENILRIEVTAGDKLRMASRVLSSDDEALITRLLEDCRANPGIRRIARNPLLLTLLVMIYANSGPLAAKRHRVYAQAVQTLVSVRNRTSGQTVLSEADLRHRLGFAALSLFYMAAVEVPSRDQVVDLIAKSLEADSRTGNLREEASEFLQSVAENTGLILIHQRAGSESTVSFLHHSFLEYYAAVGFIESNNFGLIRSLSIHARWREVLAVMAGILGDRADVTSFITELMREPEPADPITKEALLFAFDCALECDVPPDGTQRQLIDAVDETMRRGPGLVDPELRRELGERLGRLWSASGSDHLRRLLERGAQDSDPLVRAAFVELAGRVGMHGALGKTVVESVEKAAGDEDSPTRIAAFAAMERSSQFRTPAAIEAIRRAFKGSVGVRFAAATTVEAVPGFAKDVREEIIAALDDPQQPIAGVAARAVLEGGLGVDLNDPSGRRLLDKCLRQWERISTSGDVINIRVRVKRDEAASFLSSPLIEERLLAIRLLPWLEREERFVHDRLIEIIRLGRDRSETTAALGSLRLARAAVALSTLADVELIKGLLKSHYRDIRVAACRALSAFPFDNTILESMIEMLGRSDKSEFRDCLRSLVDYGQSQQQVRQVVFDETMVRLTGDSYGNPNEQYELRRLLGACESLGGEAPAKLERAILQIVTNFKASKELRQQALRSYARVAVPRATTVETLIDILGKSDPVLSGTITTAVHEFVQVCRQRIEYVRAVFPVLPRLGDALIARWNRSGPTSSRHIDDPALRAVRGALREVSAVLVGFSEFAEFKKVGPAT